MVGLNLMFVRTKMLILKIFRLTVSVKNEVGNVIIGSKPKLANKEKIPISLSSMHEDRIFLKKSGIHIKRVLNSTLHFYIIPKKGPTREQKSL